MLHIRRGFFVLERSFISCISCSKQATKKSVSRGMILVLINIARMFYHVI